MQEKKYALLSVSDKNGIVDFAKSLNALGFSLLSTGGTKKAIEDADIPVQSVSEITEFPECLGGRVKTLHPKVHGAILNIRDNKDHQKQCQELNIGNIDLVCINLYPFKETVASGADFDTCIENIDIGGPAMIRSAAKNFKFVTVVTDPNDYGEIIKQISENGETNLEFREKLALKAFEKTAYYDAMIADYFRSRLDELEYPETLTISYEKVQDLRYGENPHQSAAFYQTINTVSGSLTDSIQLQGKELSYNNINDANGALAVLKEYTTEPTIVAVKHANPCGIASADSIHKAFVKAYEADPTSIFGGIVASNATIDEKTAKEMIDIFLEVVLAPDYTKEALEVFKQKPNLRVLQIPNILEKSSQTELKSVMGGILVQNSDDDLVEKVYCVTDREPTKEELEDLLFAYKAVKHTKSNAISLAKDKVLIANGPGQVNRVWPTENCITHAGKKAKGSVLASDAFFPFDDCVKLAAEAGITAIIQPGGSIRDEDSIKVCNENDIAMVFTDMRHFKHS